LVIVLEKFESLDLDYFVDGVVTLGTGELDERTYREIVIQKLRGCETRHHKYLFSLYGGRMQAFGPYRIDFPKAGAQWPRVEPTVPGRQPTGSPQLDDVLGGGLMEGAVNLLEVERGVPTEAVLMFCMGPVLTALRAGRPVVWLPSKELSPPNLPPLLRRYMGDDRLEGRLRLVDLYPTDKVEEDQFQLGLEGEPIGSYLKWDVMKFNFKNVKGPTLNIMSYDALEMASGKAVEDMRDYYANLRQTGNVDLTIARASVRSTDRLADISQVHLKLRKVLGALVLYGERPHTGLFQYDLDASAGLPQLRLTPIT
jgi:hypothetical protein